MMMRALLLSLLALPLLGQTDASDLEGAWTVDLRPTPDAAEYFVEFSISKVKGKTFEGRFYDTEISNARLNGDWGELRFAFTTADGQARYHTSGKLTDEGTIEGTTHAVGRDFLAVWTAKRKE